ncbi:hypothetical protein AB1N83_002546 [Pleurotus pulmonarius]
MGPSPILSHGFFRHYPDLGPLCDPLVARPFPLFSNLLLVSFCSYPQGIDEGGRSGTLLSSAQTLRHTSPDRERKISLPTQSNVDANDSHGRVRSITLDTFRPGDQGLLSVPDGSPSKLLSQPTGARFVVATRSPSDITTSPECCPLEKSLAADLTLPLRRDLPQSNNIRCDDPHTVRRTMSKGEHQEQSVHSGSLDPVNQKTIPQVQETQAPKKSKLLKKVLAVVLRRKNSIITEPPHKEAVQGVVGDAIAGESDATLSVPSAAYSFARNHANRQAQIRSRSNLVDDSDDDNASFFSAKSSGDDDFYASSILPPFAEAEVVNKASPEAPLSLTDVGTIDAARSDAAKTKLPLSISTTFYSSLSGVPGDDLDGGREVPIESGIQMEEMMDDSSSTASSSGRMPASPESSGELDTVQVASSPVTRENPAVTGGEDLVNPLAEGKDKVQPVTQEMGNHEFLQFERTLDSKTIEINVAEQAVRVSKDSPLGDVVLSHLPISGAASSLVCSEVEIVQESLHCEIQEQFTSSKINTEDIERSAAIIPRASPDSAMRLELVPLPQDKGDPTIVPETTAHSVVAEQTIRVVESQTTGHGFISQALNVGGEHAPPALPGGSPAGSVEVTQELSTSLLQEKTADVIDIQTASQGINAGSPPVHAGGESLSPRPSNEPSNATTGEPRVQEPPLSSLVQKGSPAAGPAKQVQESADGGVEMMLQQFFQMAERMSSQSGDTERSPHPQTKPVNFVINVTNNHISTVAHGAGGDNYYGPIGQSAIGGQGGYNDIKNHQTKEITHITQSFESQTHLANTVKAY